jgi:hypothetical protein
MKKVVLGSLAVSGMMLFTACGSGGGSASTAKDVTGKFIDAAVSGLKYECAASGLNGMTNNAGEYTCKEGDTVSFFAGKYKIGSTTASTGITTPYSLYPNDVKSAINVAQLLQTLDSDGDGVIAIPAGYNLLDAITTAPTASDFDSVIGGSIGKALVTEEEAEANMNDNIAKNAPAADLKALLGGKTFYGDGDHKIAFNAEVTSFTYTEDGESGTETVNIDGNKLIFPEVYGILVAQTNDYLIFANYKLDGTYREESRMFYDKAKAKEYWDSFTYPDTEIDAKTVVSGKTYYVSVCNEYPSEENPNIMIKNDHVEKLIFKTDGKLNISWMENNELITKLYNYSTTGDTINLETNDKNVMLEIFEVGNNWFKMTNGRGGVSTYYTQEALAIADLNNGICGK